MQLEKKYYTVQDSETLKLMFQHIEESDIIAVDTETTGLNPRKDKIIGWSISGDEGIGFYLPTLVWNFNQGTLDLQTIDDTSTEVLSKNLLKMLLGKKLVFHNASFDVQFIKNYFDIDLLPYVWVDTGLLVHTVYEEGAFGFGNPFGLKSIAIMNQEALGLDVEKAANEEQVVLKESIKIMEEVLRKKVLRSIRLTWTYLVSMLLLIPTLLYVYVIYTWENSKKKD